MNEESRNPDIDPELETRIVALVLGEASDFEREHLDRLMEDRPELVAFKETIQSMHGLLRDVATGESAPEDDDWKLPAEKRTAVLAVIRGETIDQPTKSFLKESVEKRADVNRGVVWSFAKVAAVFCIAGCMGCVAIALTLWDRLPNSSLLYEAELASAFESQESISELSDEFRSASGESSMTSGPFGLGGDVENEELGLSLDAASFEIDRMSNSESALSGIRDSLDSHAKPRGYYFDDDVQYYPESADFDFEREKASQPGTDDWKKRARTVKEGERNSYSLGIIINSDGNRPEGILIDRPDVDALDSLPKPNETLAPLNQDSDGRLNERYADGETLPGSQPTPARPGNGELSFPKIADSRSEIPRFGYENTASPPIRVPDNGTVLRGGVTRSVSGPGAGDIATESFERPPVTEYDDNAPGVGGESQNGGNLAGSSSVDRPPVEKEPGHVPNYTLDLAGSQESGRGQAWGQQQLQQFGDTLELPDPPDVLKGGVIDDAGEGQQWTGPSGGGFGGGLGNELRVDEIELTEDHNFKYSPMAQPEASEQQGSRPQNGAGHSVVPSLADFVPEGESGQLDYSKEEALEDQSSPDSSLESVIPSPGQAASSEDFFDEQNGIDVGRYAEQSATSPDDESSSRYDDRTLEFDAVKAQPTPAPITGTVQGVPGGESRNGQGQPNGHWAYDSKAEPSLEKVPFVNRLFSNDGKPGDVIADKDREQNWSRREGISTGEKDLFVRQGFRSHSYGANAWEGYVPPMLTDNSKSMETAHRKKSVASAGVNEKTAKEEPVSTFSLHVSDVSFKLALSALTRGELPATAQIRIEEFINAFDYGDPLPSPGERVSCRMEQSIHPFLQQRNLLRVSMRTAIAGRASHTPLRLTFLLDNSGSMERIDRQQTVRRAFALLAQQLKPFDQVTLISFARQPRLLADKVSGEQSQQLVNVVENLPSEGGTNLEAALQLAFEKAREQQSAAAQNRIVLLTDGAVNLGDANPERLSRMIANMREAGIAFDAAGISAEGLNDEVLEALTRKGDGRYYLLDSVESADDGFVRQIAGALRPSAKNVKVQIEFNPKRVGRYKLLGFEKHRLNKEDFRNDSVDAAEMAAAEAGVAVYQFQADPDGEGDIGSVSVRFLDLSSGQMVENRWPIPYDADAPRLDRAAPSLRIATSAALLAAKLRGDPLGEAVDLKTLSNLISGLPDQVRSTQRVGQLQLMIQQVRQLTGE